MTVMRSYRVALAALCVTVVPGALPAQSPLSPAAETAIDAIEPQVIAWHRDIHQHPELGNREFRTAGIVAAHLHSLGMEVDTAVAHTGVVGMLRGARPGPVIMLRVDMDGLPVTERAPLP